MQYAACTFDVFLIYLFQFKVKPIKLDVSVSTETFNALAYRRTEANVMRKFSMNIFCRSLANFKIQTLFGRKLLKSIHTHTRCNLLRPEQHWNIYDYLLFIFEVTAPHRSRHI